MKAYRVYYDKVDKKWKYENFLSEVGHTTDFECWNATLLGAQKVCNHYNENFVNDFVEGSEEMFLMYSDKQYTICTCKDCKEDYMLPFSEFLWFYERGLSIPKRCSKCRSKRRRGVEA